MLLESLFLGISYDILYVIVPTTLSYDIGLAPISSSIEAWQCGGACHRRQMLLTKISQDNQAHQKPI